MIQEIKIECDDHSFNIFELSALRLMARKYQQHNLRVTDDKTNIKVYIGTYYQEPIRYWLNAEGLTILVEKDVSAPEDEDGDWQPIEIQAAYQELMSNPATATVPGEPTA